MKTLITILVIAVFLQTTIVPMDLVLLILICRAYVKSDSANLYLAFAFGILTSHLNLVGFGLQSVVNLAIIQATQILSKLRLAGNPLLVIPVSFCFLSLSQLINSMIYHQVFDLVNVAIAAFLSLPILYAVRLWEERFIVKKGIKLRI